MFAGAVVAAALAPGAASGASPDASAQLVVHVRDGDGRPIPLAWVAVSAGVRATWSRVREGKASLSRAALHDGSASVEVFGAAADRDAPLPCGAWRGPLPSGANEITARLGVERRIDGFVRDARGRGIEAALVRAFPEDGEWDPADE